MKLILASQSPRRKELLGLMNIPFEVRVSDADETMDRKDNPACQVGLVSQRKAMAIPRNEEEAVIAADTVVVCDGQILGKPKTPDEAAQMLQMLSGRTHQVMTGLTVLYRQHSYTCTEVTQVTFRQLSRQEIVRYVQTGEPMDKAGAYGVQGGGALFVTHLDGDYYNVMGLPVCKLYCVLRQLIPELMEERI